MPPLHSSPALTPSPPLISILMPVRNEERYLQEALDSVVRQTSADWELVAVDDGSTDATPAILAAAAARDSRIRVMRLPGRGLVTALNAGLAQCRGLFLARMDGDDVCHPRRLERQAAFLIKNPQVGLVASSFRHFPRAGLRRGMLDYEKWQNSLLDQDRITRDLFVESPFVHPGVMTRRSVVENAGGYRDCGWAEDYDLWLRMAAQGITFARLPEPLFFWRDHPKRETRTSGLYAQDAMRRCKLHHLRRGFLQGIEELVIAGAGQEARAWQRLLAVEGVRVSHWLDVDPRKLGRILHGAPVLHSSQLDLAGRKMIVAIGLRGARTQFREVAAQRGWLDGKDFVCVA
jgi:glycosyltransferase involved in cell wall biosynthesis